MTQKVALTLEQVQVLVLVLVLVQVLVQVLVLEAVPAQGSVVAAVHPHYGTKQGRHKCIWRIPRQYQHWRSSCFQSGAACTPSCCHETLMEWAL